MNLHTHTHTHTHTHLHTICRGTPKFHYVTLTPLVTNLYKHTYPQQVEAQLAFDWHWEKLGMMGSGKGELNLLGGDINYRFRCVPRTS